MGNFKNQIELHEFKLKISKQRKLGLSIAVRSILNFFERKEIAENGEIKIQVGLFYSKHMTCILDVVLFSFPPNP
jgi:hypothetical protein